MPATQKPHMHLRGVVGRSGTSLAFFIHGLLVENEQRFLARLEQKVRSLKRLPPGHTKVPLPPKEKYPLPRSDRELEALIRREFADHQSVLNAFDSRVYTIAHFRSRYRKERLIAGQQNTFVSLCYISGHPISNVGASQRPLTYAEIAEELQSQCESDPRIPLLKKLARQSSSLEVP